jgi:hypothetical protein
MADRDAEKRAAAEAAAALVEDGSTVGLGTGSTVAHLLPALARRMLALRCVATSVATEEAARALGMEVTEAHEKRRRLYNEKLLKMPPEQAARTIVAGVEAGRPRVLVGNDARTADLLVRLLPRRYPALVARLERRLFGTARG